MTLASVTNTPGSNGLTANNIYPQSGVVLYGLSIAVSGNSTTVSKIVIPSGFTNLNTLFTNGKLYSSASNTYTAGSVTQVAGTGVVGTTVAIGTNSITITGISQAFTAGTTRYYYLMLDYTYTGTSSYAANAFNNTVVTYSVGAGTSTSSTYAGSPYYQLRPTTVAFTSVTNTTGNNGLSAGNIYAQNGLVLYGFSATVPGGSATITQLDIGSTNNTLSAYFSNAKLYTSTSSTFNLGTATQIAGAGVSGTTATVGTGNTVTFTGLSESLTNGTTKYYYLVIDYSVSGTDNVTFKDITGTLSTGGTTAGTTYGPYYNINPTSVTVTQVSSGLTSNATAFAPGQTNIAMFGFSVNVLGGTTLSGFNINSVSALSTPDNYLDNGKLYVSTSSTYDGTAVQIAGAGVSGTAVTFNGSFVNITGLNQVFTSGQTMYYYLVADYIVYTGINPGTVQFSFASGQSPAALIQSPSGSYNTYSFNATNTYSFKNAITVTALNGAVNGITTTLANYGDSPVVFAFSVATVGTLTLNRVNIAATAVPGSNGIGTYYGSGTLYSSTTPTYSTANPVGSVTINAFAGGMSVTGLTEVINNTTKYYFLKLNYTNTNAISGTLQFNFNTSQGAAALMQTTPAASYNTFDQPGVTFNMGVTYDWAGGSAAFATASNWRTLSNGLGAVPGQYDQVRIGFVPYASGSFQPSITAASTIVANIVFGTNNTPALTLANNSVVTLTGGITVNSSATPTITGGTGSSISALTFKTNPGSTTALSVPVGLTGATTGILTNDGTINLSTGTIAGSITAAAPSTNSGTINLAGSSALTFSAAATNTGTISTASTGSVAFATTLDNTDGTITKTGATGLVSFTGAVTNGAGGTITQNGASGLMRFFSTLDNTGTVTQSSAGPITFSGAITNSGIINRTGTGTITISSTVANSGTITQAGSTGLMTFPSTVNNSGTITQDAGGAGGITFAGVVTNTSTGVINQNAISGTAMTFSVSPANSGNINQTAAGAMAFSAALTNAGTITRTGTGTFTLTGSTTNSGTIIQGGALGLMTFPGTVNNSGTITQDAGGAGGIKFSGIVTNTATGVINQNATSGTAMTFTLSPVNTGDINLTAAGGITFSAALTNAGNITRTGTGALTLTGSTINSGTITQGASGLLTFPNTLNNSGGTITQSATGTGGITFSGIVTTNASSIFNQSADSGTAMTFSAAQTTPVFLGQLNITSAGSVVFSGALTTTATIAGTGSGDLTITGALINNSGGAITQSSTGDLIIGSTTRTISNTGTISQTGSGAFTRNGTGLVTNNSGGQITLGSGTSSFASGVTNASGATFTFGSGTASITGAVSNGGTMAGGSGTITFSSTFTNTSTGNFDGGTAAETFTGAFSNANIYDISTGTSDFNSTFTNTKTVTASGGTTYFSNNFTNTSPGTFIASGGTIIFDRQAAQTISSTTTATPVAFYNLTVTNANATTFTKQLSGAGSYTIASQGLLSVTGKTIFDANGKLTLLSDAFGSASVDKITGTQSSATPPIIINNVNVQRYFPGGALYSRGYTLLSSPVSVSATNLIIPNLTFLPNTTGTGTGFTQTGNPSLYLYRENLAPIGTAFTAAGNYRSIKSISGASTITIDADAGNFNLPAGNGILFFFRGGTTTTLPFVTSSTAAAATLSQTGVLNQGNITVKSWWYTVNSGSGLMYTISTGNTKIRGYNLVGNPYASSIDWDTFGTAITGTNVESKIWIYNPKTKGYATYVAGVGGTGFNGGSPNIIPSGQGFFVKASDVSPTLTFTEDAKVNASVPAANLLFNAAVAPPIKQYLRLQLFKDTLNIDETLIFFRGTAKTKFVDAEDAEYLKANNLVSLATRSADDVPLAINQMPFPQQRQVIPLNVTIAGNGIYQLNLTEVKNIPAEYNVWLFDAYQKDSLDIKHNPTYSFNATTKDTNSYGSKRFSLVLGVNPSLGVHLLNFTGTKTLTEVKLAWVVENEASHTRYVLERSINGGKSFSVLDSLTSVGLGVYTDIDPNPVKGQNLYRLKQVDVLGNITYSSTIPIMYADNVVNSIAANLLSVYPNPVSSTLNLAINPATTADANYKITITNSSGITVKSTTSNQPKWQGDVSTLLPGTYFVQVVNIKNNTITATSPFIKL